MSETTIEELLSQVTQGRVFDPETIQLMVSAIEGATAQLPLHAGSKYAIGLANSVMDQAALGERNVRIMQSIALLSVHEAGN
jgi:hypothetical protein